MSSAKDEPGTGGFAQAAPTEAADTATASEIHFTPNIDLTSHANGKSQEHTDVIHVYQVFNIITM
jgi:hypothetical protein